MPTWNDQDVPPQDGRVALITGANSGLGFENAVSLARKGAAVIMACRNLEKGAAAQAQLQTAVPAATTDLRRLDLADLSQIAEFAAGVTADYPRLDMLINNAGLMAVPRWETVDGFEMQFGVNHLGHFALTGHLLPLLRATPASRVVTVSSLVAWVAKINFSDLMCSQSYTRYGAYGQSKLANILFARELAQRARAAGADLLSMPAHPGYSATNLQEASASSSGSGVEGAAYGFLNKVLAQSAAMGALPQLYAATAPDVQSGVFYGPEKFSRGYPKAITPPKAACDEETARRLWQESESLTGVVYAW